MTRQWAIDPELLDLLGTLARPRLDATALRQLRQRLVANGDGYGPELATREDQVVSADGASISISTFRPSSHSGSTGAILFIHGGGFVLGSVAGAEARCREIVADHHCTVVAVDYRLAPEAPYPKALQDCEAAIEWMFANSGKLGADPSRIGLVGVSAGAGLAAGLALKTRDEGRSPVAFLHLTYPMLDDRTGAPGTNSHGSENPVLSAEDNRFCWQAYLGDSAGGPDTPAYAAPARARWLGNLPPTFISTGTLDLFAAENLSFAERLLADGTPIEFHLYPGGFHGFDLHPTASVASRARRNSHEALRRFLSNPAPATCLPAPEACGQVWADSSEVQAQ